MRIRRAALSDLDAVDAIYDHIHDTEEQGRQTIGWVRGVYPTRRTAEDALTRGDLFVLEENERILGCGIINAVQVDVYRGAPWRWSAEDAEVCVLHTLVISPDAAGKGYGKAFVTFYEDYAREHGRPELRIDTNARNTAARRLYRRLGYEEIAVVPTVFNGIPRVDLVLLEKHL